MSNETIKNTVRKLLNLASDDAAFEGEIDNALRAARALMLKHNLTEDDIVEERPMTVEQQAAVAQYGQAETFTKGGKMSTWEVTLGAAINDLVGTTNWYVDSGTFIRRVNGLAQVGEDGEPVRSRRVVFYGPDEDARDAAALYEEWTHVIATMGRLKWGGCFRGEGLSYAEGFARSLRLKVANIIAAEPKSLTGATGTALVVVKAHSLMKAKLAQAEKFIRGHVNIRKSAKRKSYANQHGHAFIEGRNDGERAEFSRTITRKLAGA